MRIGRVTASAVLLLGAIVLLSGGLSPALAQEEQAREATGDSGDSKAGKKEERQRWRQEQIEKLHQREAEKKAAREQREAEKEAAREQREAEQPVETETDSAGGRRGRAAAAGAAASEGTRRRSGRATRGGGALAEAQARVRASQFGEDPLVQEYLDLFDRDAASTAHYSTFANFLAQQGWFDEAITYYRAAIRREPDNDLLWLNVGTLEAQRGDHDAAINAFGRALAISPNNALAHYNMGVSLQALNRYEDAVAEFASALRLDPSLADPEVNPQAVNNSLLLAVKLRLYQSQIGAASLPLVDIAGDDDADGREPDR